MKEREWMEREDTVELQEEETNSEKPGKRRRKRRRGALTGSFPAKVAAFFLLVVSGFVTAASALGCALAVDGDIYGEISFTGAFLEIGYSPMMNAAYTVRSMIQDGAETWEIEQYFSSLNLDVDIYQSPSQRIWGTYDGSYRTDFTLDFMLPGVDVSEGIRIDKGEITLSGETLSEETTYLFRVYVDPSFPHNDRIRKMYEGALFLYNMRYAFIWTALCGVCVLSLSFIFLMCSAGHSNKKEKQSPAEGGFFGIPLDILTAVFLPGMVGIEYVGYSFLEALPQAEIILALIFVGATAAATALWVTLFFFEVARQLKRGKWWRHTVTFWVLNVCLRALRLLGRGCFALLNEVPAALTAVMVYLGICVLEFFGMLLFARPEAAALVLWFLEKVIVLILLLYVAYVCGRLLKGSKAMAEGRQDYVVDTSVMFGEWKEHGENLNSIGEGISRAVEERMKSERLKTELITNVSHDLKTPLTSIINYSALICEEETENEKITEYSQVLQRQSGRLKKLLEDLLEASKATTGNLEVNLTSCEVGVILSQAVGEYQKKLEEKGLDLRIAQPEEPVWITADGRHLWRVFDNLLSNICKYAQEDSRVYLNVELKEETVRIIFRNMSKYPLSVSAEDLEERFVRGDRSRHMEGNGLGLSIAKSLIDLQNGRMEIVTDGDLFKVTLTFRQLKES